MNSLYRYWYEDCLHRHNFFLGQFCPRGKSAMKLTLCEAVCCQFSHFCFTNGTFILKFPFFSTYWYCCWSAKVAAFEYGTGYSYIPSLATTCPHACQKNMFWEPIKISSFDNQSSKFTRPLKNGTYANDRSWFIYRLATEHMAFTINKFGRNFKQGAPLSSDLRNQLKVAELVQLHSYREVGRGLRSDAKRVSKAVEQFWESGSTAPKPLNQTRTASKCIFQDSML